MRSMPGVNVDVMHQGDDYHAVITKVNKVTFRAFLYWYTPLKVSLNDEGKFEGQLLTAE